MELKTLPSTKMSLWLLSLQARRVQRRCVGKATETMCVKFFFFFCLEAFKQRLGKPCARLVLATMTLSHRFSHTSPSTDNSDCVMKYFFYHIPVTAICDNAQHSDSRSRADLCPHMRKQKCFVRSFGDLFSILFEKKCHHG